jgi:hypothetical protein
MDNIGVKKQQRENIHEFLRLAQNKGVINRFRIEKQLGYGLIFRGIKSVQYRYSTVRNKGGQEEDECYTV